MALVGYARTSTADQNPETQEVTLTAAGAERIFTDAGLSSRLSDRPQWRACLEFMRAGDVLLVYRLDRLAGSVGMLIETISEASTKIGVNTANNSNRNRHTGAFGSDGHGRQ